MTASEPKKLVMPKLSDQMTEAVIAKWLVADGDWVSNAMEIAEVETDKTVVELLADGEGFIRIGVPEGTLANLGEPVALLFASESAASSAELPNGADAGRTEPDVAENPSEPEAFREPEEHALAQRVPFASPLVRKLAKDSRLDLGGISGSGPGGRIVRRDIESLLQQARAAGAATVAATPEPSTGVGGGQTVEMTRRQRIVAERMTESKRSIPEFSVTNDLDVTALLAFREQLKAVQPSSPTLNDLFVKAVALAVKEWPMLNARVSGTSITYFDRVHVGVAVAREADLLVPVVKNADRLSIMEIAAEAKRLAAGVRENRLAADELQGGTITVSNLGKFGVSHFVPILNAGQAAIIGLGGARSVAEFDGDELVKRFRTGVTVTADHRVIYGAHAAQFLDLLQVIVAEPLRLAF